MICRDPAVRAAVAGPDGRGCQAVDLERFPREGPEHVLGPAAQCARISGCPEVSGN